MRVRLDPKAQVPVVACYIEQVGGPGWVLLPVPYWEWDALGSSKAAKEEYLRAAILGLSEARHTSELISEEGRAVQAHGHSVHGLKGSACVCVSV